MQAIFNSPGVSITKNGKLCTGWVLSENLYVLNRIPAHYKFVAWAADVDQRHEQLCHVFHYCIKHRYNQNAVTEPHILHPGLQSTCPSCTVATLTRSDILKLTLRSNHKVLDIVHSDICGPWDTPSKGGARWFVTFTDSTSMCTILCSRAYKSGAFWRFWTFLASEERQRDCKRKSLVTAVTGQLVINELPNVFAGHGLVRRVPWVDGALANGAAEGMNHTLLDLVMPKCHTREFLKSSVWMQLYQPLITTSELIVQVPQAKLHSKRGLVQNLTSQTLVFTYSSWYQERKGKTKKPGDRRSIRIDLWLRTRPKAVQSMRLHISKCKFVSRCYVWRNEELHRRNYAEPVRRGLNHPKSHFPVRSDLC